MDCCGKGSSSVSISGNGGGERLKAEAEAAIRALDDNEKVVLNILINDTSINVLVQVVTGEFKRLVKKNGELNVSFPHKYWAPWHFFRKYPQRQYRQCGHHQQCRHGQDPGDELVQLHPHVGSGLHH